MRRGTPGLQSSPSRSTRTSETLGSGMVGDRGPQQSRHPCRPDLKALFRPRLAADGDTRSAGSGHRNRCGPIAPGPGGRGTDSFSETHRVRRRTLAVTVDSRPHYRPPPRGSRSSESLVTPDCFGSGSPTTRPTGVTTVLKCPRSHPVPLLRTRTEGEPRVPEPVLTLPDGTRLRAG